MRQNPFRLGSALALVLIGVWLWLAYLQVGCLASPWMDSWCYFAPGVLARHPFGLTLPLLDGYRGADTTWAIHWPGAPLFYSLFGPWLRWHPTLYPLLPLGLWLGLAFVARSLVRRLTQGSLASCLIVVAILMDRGLLAVAGDRRPEIFACLCVMIWLVAATRSLGLKPTRWDIALLMVSAMAGTLAHPVTLACMGGMAVLALIGLVMGRLPRLPVLSHCVGAAAGVMIFVGRLWLLPHALEQFQDHAKVNAIGGMLHVSPWLGAMNLYFPSPTGMLALVMATVFSILVLLRLTASPMGLRVPSVAFLGMLAATHLLPNFYYVTVLMPLALMLAVIAILRLAESVYRRWRLPVRPVMLGLFVVFVAGNAGYWVFKTRLYYQVGQPNLTAELDQWYHTLPAGAHRILIPDHLWEAGALDAQHEVAFVTPPYAMSPELRLAYERQVNGKLASGDLVVVDLAAKDSLPQLQPWLTEKWPLIMRDERSLPSRTFWGHRFEVYRKP